MKKGKTLLSLGLRKNPDILGEILKRKRPSQVVVGFAAETDHLAANVKAKWMKKPCDLLVANQVGRVDSGFESDGNEVLLFSRFLPKPLWLKKDLKSRLAEKILDLAGKISGNVQTKDGKP